MKKTKTSVYILSIIMIVYFILVKVLIIPKLQGFYQLINIIFWTLLSLISYFLLKPTKSRSRSKVDTYQFIIIISVLYLVIIYFLGILLGFSYSPYNFNFFNVFGNTFCNAIIIVSIEILRYCMIKNTDGNKKSIVFITIIFTLIDIYYLFFISNYLSGLLVFKFLLVQLIPSLSKNIMLTYISFKVGYIPGIIYRLIMELYVYLIPIIPNINEYVTPIILTVIPLVIMYFLSTIYIKEERRYTIIQKNGVNILYSITLIICIFMISLILGLFRYKLIAIISNSMLPTFRRGDGIIYKKIATDNQAYEELEVGDILVYQKNELQVVHRIIEKDNGIIYTQGDNNNVKDDPVSSQQFIGVVKIIVPYVGYPSILVQELLKK